MEEEIYTIHQVFSLDDNKFLAEILPYLEASIQFSDEVYEVNDIIQGVKTNNLQMFCFVRDYLKPTYKIMCVVVTEIKYFPRAKHFNILFLGGKDMSKWIHLTNDIIKMAKNHGCKAVKVYGRPGWEKVLDKFGFKKSHVVLKANI